ncbi:transmembrane protein 154 isoform X2 [Tupaia chinensis]|uniref:transmembrane protein 154 isoform X2 n=1 Tax=Tupaia chinensis TaxID=246437 RepID=UPI000FFBCA7A|nr:transmembrane protein 154 isoform X2 [Tupaia chinensis]
MPGPRAARLLALLGALLHAGRGDYEDSDPAGESPTVISGDALPSPSEDVLPSPSAAVTTDPFAAYTSSSHTAEDKDELAFILMVLIPSVLLVLLFLSVILFVMRYKRKQAKQEPSSQGSQSALQTYELGSENLKVPIFEEDTPSVMEIEMEELDKWMNSMNRNADYECLPTLKEEKESNHSPRNK